MKVGFKVADRDTDRKRKERKIILLSVRITSHTQRKFVLQNSIPPKEIVMYLFFKDSFA